MGYLVVDLHRHNLCTKAANADSLCATIWDMESGLSIAAFATSVLAVGLSSLLTMRNIEISRRANHVPVIIEFLDKYRSIEFIQHEEYLWDHIGEHSQDLGFWGLPEPVKSYALEVAYHYQTIAYITFNDVVDRKSLIPQIHYRVTKTWQAISPHVEGERVNRGGEYTFLNLLEALVQKMASLDIQALSEKQARRLL
jgi:hypothetical protein